MSRLARLVGTDPELLGDRNFQLLMLGSVVSPLGASVVSPILESLIGPYGATETSVGLLMAAFTAPAVVAIPLVGALVAVSRTGTGFGPAVRGAVVGVGCVLVATRDEATDVAAV